MKQNVFKLKLWLRSYRAKMKLLRELRRTGIHVYSSKRKAIRKGKIFTFFQRQRYWVMPADEQLYYTLNMEDIHRLNKNNMNVRNGIKVRTRDLDGECIWSSPKYAKIR